MLRSGLRPFTTKCLRRNVYDEMFTTKEGAAITSIRTVHPDDLPALKKIIDETELFPSELLDDMMARYFAGEDDSQWLTYDNGNPVAVAYVTPEPMTSGTWNALLLAVHPKVQGQGFGTALMRHIEGMLTERGARVLLVETSGLGAFKPTRQFYGKIGYKKEACIRDFYDAGDDKIVFRKALGASSQQEK